MKLCTLIFPFAVQDMIYQNRLGNNRMIAGMRLSAAIGTGPNWSMSRLVEFLADNLETPKVRKVASVMVNLHKSKNKNRRGRRYLARKIQRK